MKRLLLVGAIALSACAEEPAAQPIASGGPRSPVAEPADELIVNPHVRLRERSDLERQREAERLGLAEGSADRARPGSGGGGGGGGGGRDPDWDPSPADPPTQRQVEEFRRQLEQELPSTIDPDDDPCEQLAASAEATARSGDRAVGETGPSVADPAARRQLERMCQRMPPGYRQCMDREYFRAHMDECQREMGVMSRRGQRISDRAQQQLDAIEAGREPSPTSARARRAAEEAREQREEEAEEEPRDYEVDSVLDP